MIKKNSSVFFLAKFFLALLLFNSCRKEEARSVQVSSPAISLSVVSPVTIEVFGGKERDLGVISEHDVIPLEFTLHNAGKTVQTILNVSFSCPCGEILNPPNNESLQPDGTYTLKLNLFGNRISFGEFSRFLVFDLDHGQNIGITIRGHIQANIEVIPSRVINLGLLTDSGEAWEKEVQITGVNQLASGFRLAPDPKSDLFDLRLEELSQGSYTLNVRPKQSLPYTRRFRSTIQLPILEPSGLPALSISIVGQIGEDIIFHPSSFSLQESDFSGSDVLIRTASFGMVPVADGNAEKQAQGTEQRNEDRRRFTRLFFQPAPRTSITTIAWAPLFGHLEFDCPSGVRVEKELHENGISLRLHISRSAFAEKQRISIIPRRDQNKFRKINLIMLREKSVTVVEQAGEEDHADAEEDDDKEEGNAD